MRVNVPVIGLCVTALLSVSAFATAADDTRLAEAAKRRDAAAVRTLIKEHVNPSAALNDGGTALHWAAQWNDLDTARLLIEAKADVNAADVYGVTPIALAATNGSADMVTLLLKSGANAKVALPSGETPLMTASRAGKVAAVAALLDAGSDIEAKESVRGQNALMWAAAERNLDVVKLLIEKGANPSAKAKSGFTPLLFAAQRGDTAVTEALLKAGVKVNETATNGMSAVVLAILAEQFDHAKFLLDKGADPNLGPGYGALHLVAAEEGKVEGADIEEGGGANIGTLFGEPKQAMIKLLLDKGARINEPTKRMVKGPGTIGATPFWLAAWAGDPDSMKLLLEKGADPKIKTPQGTTALMVAAGVFRQAGGPNVTEDRALAAVKICVEQGIDVNAANESHGDTAMHGAGYRGMHGGARIAQYLLEHGAKADPVNKRAWTPYMLAEGLYFSTYNTTNLDTAKVLKTAGAKPFPAGFPTNTGIRSSEIWYEPGFEPATLGSEGASKVK